MDINDLTIGQAKELAAMFGQCQSVEMVPTHHEQPVIVTTEHRGVVFGYTENVSARPIALKRARMCLYWSRDVGGIFGLAENGPSKDSKISATLPQIQLEAVTAVMTVDPKAEKAWTSAPITGR